MVGGGRPAHLDKGYYVEPTLFADVDNSMSIAREEIFGPVLVVVPFDDDDDAVRLANENQYGLGVGVTSASEERALAVARRVRAGTVGVNGGVWYGADAPFGGYKASGIGRQNGRRGLRAVHRDQDLRRLAPARLGPGRPPDGSGHSSIVMQRSGQFWAANQAWFSRPSGTSLASTTPCPSSSQSNRSGARV